MNDRGQHRTPAQSKPTQLAIGVTLSREGLQILEPAPDGSRSPHDAALGKFVDPFKGQDKKRGRSVRNSSLLGFATHTPPWCFEAKRVWSSTNVWSLALSA